jgi:hypothetical protein
MSYAITHAAHIKEATARIGNAYKCLRLVHEVFPFRSVVDFGCGIGGWLVAAKQLGAERTLGLEAEWIKDREKLVDASEITICDLASSPPKFGRTFDLAISIEVAEHLPPESADGLCDALVNAADLVVFSAAVPGQGGDNHVNEQKPRYWVDKFWHRSFMPLEMVRPVIINDPIMFPWLKQNVIVFANYSLLCSRSSLKQYMMPREYFYNLFWSM